MVKALRDGKGQQGISDGNNKHLQMYVSFIVTNPFTGKYPYISEFVYYFMRYGLSINYVTV